AEVFHQGLSVAERASGRAEAGQGERVNLLPRHLEQIDRLARDQQRQRRIEPAGNADRHALAVDMLEPPGQAGDLRMKAILAALAELLGAARHERVRIDLANQAARRAVHRERDPPPRTRMNMLRLTERAVDEP